MPKSLDTLMQDHLKEVLNKYFEEEDSFILGVSGGPDSMALLYLMHLLNRDVLVVHVNYGKRGDSSDKDQELVEQMSFAWGFESCSVSLDPVNAKNQNFQKWARDQRYQFFRDLKENNSAAAIITAHHQQDQVETILQKILRGSAPPAWQGMTIWDGELLRPLLPFSKDQIIKFCDANSVPFRIDESNENSDFARNFIRNQLSEKLDELFPGWQQNLLDLNTFGSAYSSAIDFVLKSISVDGSIELKELRNLNPDLKRAVLKRFLDVNGLEGRYSKQQLKDLEEIESLQTGKSIRFGDAELIRDRNLIRLNKTLEIDSPEPEILNRSDAVSGYETSYFTVKLSDQKPSSPSLRIDSSKLDWPLEIRQWKHGDSFSPLGLDGSQKVSDHLTNRKIPTVLREKALVLCGSGGSIYAIIYPDNADIVERGAIADPVKCDPHTQTYLTINF